MRIHFRIRNSICFDIKQLSVFVIKGEKRLDFYYKVNDREPEIHVDLPITKENEMKLE